MYSLRVFLVDPDRDFRRYIKEIVHNAGHMVVGEAADGRNGLRMIFNIQPDLVIMNPALPGKNGIEVARTIEEHRIAPVILITDLESQDELMHCLEEWTISYIVKPVDETNLIPAIEVCRSVYKKICRLEEENRKLKQTIETRKVVEKAKGLLVEMNGMTEKEAYKHIQKISMDKSLPLRNVATKIISALELRKAKKLVDRDMLK